MSKSKNNILLYLVLGTLVGTGLIGIVFYFFYGLEIAIVSIFGALLAFTIIHIIIFYFWLKKQDS